MVIEIIGLIGVAGYVLSYALLQTGVIKGNGYLYPSMNLVGASFVAISLLNNWNMWSFLTSVMFTTFSLIGITRVYLANRKLHFTDQEQRLFDERFGMLTRGDMRRVLNAGEWMQGRKGELLTKQGEPVRQLSYIFEGGVDILLNNRKITEVGAGEFIGELASLSGGVASATVRLNQPSLTFVIPATKLRALVRGKPDLRAQLEFSFAGNIRSKLLATNARLHAVLEEHGEVAAPREVLPATNVIGARDIA